MSIPIKVSELNPLTQVTSDDYFVLNDSASVTTRRATLDVLVDFLTGSTKPFISSSYALLALSASYALSSSYALSASYSKDSLSSSYALRSFYTTYVNPVEPLPANTVNMIGTASWALNSINATNFEGTASWAHNAKSALYASQSQWSVSASWASSSLTASYFLGDVTGTASWAHNAKSALYASQSQWSVSASWASSSLSASYSLNSTSASYSLSGSYALTASYVQSNSDATGLWMYSPYKVYHTYDRRYPDSQSFCLLQITSSADCEIVIQSHVLLQAINTNQISWGATYDYMKLSIQSGVGVPTNNPATILDEVRWSPTTVSQGGNRPAEIHPGPPIFLTGRMTLSAGEYSVFSISSPIYDWQLNLPFGSTTNTITTRYTVYCNKKCLTIREYKIGSVTQPIGM